MCESHTVHHLCGHIKIKTIIQCANIIEKLIAGGLPITENRQVCEEDVSDNVHVFPDICEKCKKTGIVGDVMEVAGMKIEVLRAWNARNKAKVLSGNLVEKEDSESDKIEELEAFDCISLSGDTCSSTPDPASATVSPEPTSRASSPRSDDIAPELSQIKTRVASLRARTERLLTKIRVQKPPTLGQPSPKAE